MSQQQGEIKGGDPGVPAEGGPEGRGPRCPCSRGTLGEGTQVSLQQVDSRQSSKSWGCRPRVLGGAGRMCLGPSLRSSITPSRFLCPSLILSPAPPRHLRQWALLEIVPCGLHSPILHLGRRPHVSTSKVRTELSPGQAWRGA